MSEFGEMAFISVSVQVIPVLALVVLAEEFLRRDQAVQLHRVAASFSVAIALFAGVGGEVAGLQALLTGPTQDAIWAIDVALLTLGTTAVAPRFAELMFSADEAVADIARRTVQRFVPGPILVPIVCGILFADSSFTVRVVAFSVCGLLLAVIGFMFVRVTVIELRRLRDGRRREASLRSQVAQAPAAVSPASDALLMSRSKAGLGWVLVSAAIAIVLALRKRRP